tara:strand:- start:11522 stop:12445 length:924 start_codon:yes stop_codon:yes gene_type:complete
MEIPRRDITTDLGLLLIVLIWGVNFSVLKVLLRELDPLALNALRFPMAAVALWILVRRLDGSLKPDPQDLRRIITLGLLGNVAYQLCFIFGVDSTFAGNASLLLATTPVWTLFLSSVAGHERPGGWVVIGVAGTLIGIFMVITGSRDAGTLASPTTRGDLLILIASVLWAMYTVGGRKPVTRYGALRVTAWTLWVATPIIFFMGLPGLMRTDLTAITPEVWIGVTYAGLLGIGLAYLLWYRAVERIGNNRTAVYSNLVPVAALITAWIWLGEVPTTLQLIGAAVILVGLTLARVAHAPENDFQNNEA